MSDANEMDTVQPSNGGAMRQQDVSKQNRITNVVATTIAIAAAVVASPSALSELPSGVVTVLRTAATLDHTTQPLVVTVVGVLVAAVTHPPAWLTGLAHGVRSRL